MDKTEAKLVLESYRPQDASDPIFAGALHAVAADPELAEWFAEMQRFDAVMFGKFQEVLAPPHLKEQILRKHQEMAPSDTETPPQRWEWRWMAGAIAALLVVGLFSWRALAPARPHSQLLAQQAVNFTGHMPALQFVCFDASVVASWINEQPAARQMGLTMPKQDESMSMAMIGSSVVDWNGRPVVMVALQHDGRMAMLYILNDEAARDLVDGATEIVRQADWVVRTTKVKGQVRVLAAKGRPEDLNFPMPL